MNQHITSLDNTERIISTVTKEGQVTLPPLVRRQLGIKMQGKIMFVIKPNGTILLRPPSYASLEGAVGSLQHNLTWKEMRDVAREDRLTTKYLRKT